MKNMREKRKYLKAVMLISVLIISAVSVTGCQNQENDISYMKSSSGEMEIPEYAGEPYVEINGNIPEFTSDELAAEKGYEYYAPLDEKGRCGSCEALVGKETMPTEKRQAIGMIKPSGWHTVRYDDLISDRYLYNRCHLIGFQLAGENANERNLITGTRYLNVEGMLPFEDMIDDYVDRTGNHVLYRVTPVYNGNDLVASGVHMMAQSVEDGGKGLSFNIYCYNVQPGVVIDYSTGESRRDDEAEKNYQQSRGEETFVVNTNTGRYHNPECSSADDIKPDNRLELESTEEKLRESGYSPCGRCMK